MACAPPIVNTLSTSQLLRPPAPDHCLAAGGGHDHDELPTPATLAGIAFFSTRKDKTLAAGTYRPTRSRGIFGQESTVRFDIAPGLASAFRGNAHARSRLVPGHHADLRAGFAGLLLRWRAIRAPLPKWIPTVEPKHISAELHHPAS